LLLLVLAVVEQGEKPSSNSQQALYDFECKLLTTLFLFSPNHCSSTQLFAPPK
jgi:hypothetical protein